MAGIDDIEMQLSTGSLPTVDKRAASAAALLQPTITAAAPAAANPGAVLAAVYPPSEPVSDYDPRWPLWAHPSSFPHGTGACPKRMSLTKWAEYTVQRYPASQFAQNGPLLQDMFNIIQRHEVSVHTKVQMDYSPASMAAIASMQHAEVQHALQLMQHGPGKAQQDAQRAATPATRALLHAMKQAGGRVLGSPQSKATLRSKVCAAWNMYGPYTVQMNLCPNEQVRVDMPFL